uniref:Fucose isomerase n=2 Tax=Pseudomonadati TaxID=3379134 RepID=A0A7C4JQS6_9BACT
MKIKFLLSPIAYKVDEKLKEAKEYLGKYINLEESEDPDAIVLLTGGTEEEALKYLKDGLFIIPFGKANGLAASLEVQAYAKEKGIKTILITKPNENIMNILKVLDEFKNKKVGIIGKPSDWLIKSGNYDVLKDFGLEPIEISLKEVEENLKEDPSLADKIWNLSREKKITKEELLKATKVYTSLKKIIEKYNLYALTIRCFDLAINLKITGCLALSLLNSEGIISSCEGDIEALVTMLFVNKLTNKTPFMANLADIEKDEYTFAHCTIAINIPEYFNLNTHFETLSSVGIEGYINSEKITLLRIGRNKKFTVFTGEVVKRPFEENMCRTQITVKIKDDSFLKNPIGNHFVIVLGDEEEKIKSLEKLGWERV